MLNNGKKWRVWVIAGYRAGEHTQLIALADALGLPYEVKKLSYRSLEFRTNIFRGSDLRGIRLERSAPLQAPWPDLLLTAGMRNEPVGRWVRNQSGRRTKIVHVGRPWADPARFDLVITTPQYRLPQCPNVLQNVMTMHRVSEANMAAAASQWQREFAHLPQPYISVIVGGNSGPYTFGARAAQRLARQASQFAQARGGSLLLTSSARTAPAALRQLKQGMTGVPHYFYEWCAAEERNPYYAFLALADALIVTADSISMLTEACATGKPVYMFDPGVGGQAMRRDTSEVSGTNDFDLSTFFYRGLMRWGPQRLSRDITLVHDRLIASGNAVWLDQEFPVKVPPPLQDIDRAVERVQRLLVGVPVNP
ncbi:MAG: mitochondrial fission ELM1 family protein [Pseudomonadales bacterium]